jgi:hypothetical protein
VGDAGATALAGALEKNSTLKELELYGEFVFPLVTIVWVFNVFVTGLRCDFIDCVNI